MAIVTRRYVDVGPTNENLARFVSDTDAPVINTQYQRATVDIDVDSAVPGLVETLDNYMADINLIPSATISPKQVFAYTATGSETNPFTIGNAEGFVERMTANYVVHVTLRRPMANSIKTITVVDGTQTTTQFDLELSSSIEAGDILMFTVDDLT